MKAVVLACVLGLLVIQVLALGYHEDVGIPEAARIWHQETRVVSSRIIGGMPSSEYREHPYLAGLLITLMNGQMSVCGGTLISTNKVLTAAQCWCDGYQQGRKIEVIMDALKLFRGWRRSVSSISVHPDFDPYVPKDDLAMLTLKYSVSFYPHLRPALLPTPSLVNETFVGMAARVSGYGRTSDDTPIGPEQTQSGVTLPVINRWQCSSQLGSAITEKTICTAGYTSWGACAGDTGGPLVIRNYYNSTVNNSAGSDLLIGVVSILAPFGCQNSFPTGYMRVTSYLSWIQSNL